jgi:hypothetical protein
MPEPKAKRHIYGLVAEFDKPEALLDAARRTQEAGFVEFDTYTPFPIDGLAEAAGFKDNRVPLATLIGGIVGGAGGYGLQVYASLAFPLNIGGRPLVSPQAFALITFETAVLGAVVACVATMLLANRLPRLHHPLFELENFHLATARKLFLVIQSNDPAFDKARTRRFLRTLKPVDIAEAPFAEEPE